MRLWGVPQRTVPFELPGVAGCMAAPGTAVKKPVNPQATCSTLIGSMHACVLGACICAGLLVAYLMPVSMLRSVGKRPASNARSCRPCINTDTHAHTHTYTHTLALAHLRTHIHIVRSMQFQPVFWVPRRLKGHGPGARGCKVSLRKLL